MAESSWTDARTQRLRELHTLGHKSTEIGRELGLSKGAVIGKLHRLGLPLTSRRVVRVPLAHPRHAPARPPPPEPKPEPEHHHRGDNVVDFANIRKTLGGDGQALPPKPLPQTATAVACDESVPFHSLTPQNCRWPVGEPKTDETPFCPQQRNNGRPYCGKHNRMATISVRRRL
jgi:GcrA cell cycle regulator